MIDAMVEEILITAADHPSLAGDIDRFIAHLHAEHRYFGPTARSNPKPSRSLIQSLQGRGGFRMAAIECGRIIALARVDGGGELFMAVGAEHRGRGVGVELGRAVALRARQLNYTRLVLRSSRRSRAARRIGDELGCIVIDGPHGRTDFIIDLLPVERTA
jgi:GNAT superfamily N-acetyltransferase